MSCRQGSNVGAGHYTTQLQNTHRTEKREVIYLWHPWAGCTVQIHEVVEKASGNVARCSRDGAAAVRVCEAVQQGPSSDCDLVKLGILVWKSDDEIEVKHGRLVPGEGYQQTVADRRRRFRKQLTERMQTIGWGLLSVQRSMTFRKI